MPEGENKVAAQQIHPLPRHILIVDDDEGMGMLIGAALRGLTEVTQVTSGAQAAVTAASRQPELILLDLHMPNVNGYEVLRQIKQHPSTAGIPVICMTADRDDASRARAFELGAIGTLVKPLDVPRLPSDLGSLLALASESLESVSRRRRVVIATSAAEKNRLMKEAIRERTAEGGRVVLLSVSQGQELCDTELETLIRDETFIYLQIQVSLIAKFPYLQDFSPVTADLRGFLAEESRRYTLIFDEPQLVIQPPHTEGWIARTHALKDALARDYDEIVFYLTRAGTREAKALNELAHLLVK